MLSNFVCYSLMIRYANFFYNISADITDHADVLRRVYTAVSHKLDAQSVARHMFQCNALTLKELQSIQSKHKKPIKAVEQLLNIVMKQSDNVYGWFLDALRKTGHQHVYQLIVSDICKGMHHVLCFLCELR